MRVIALVALVDGMQGAGTGILQGMGRPRISANANLISYWAVWLPIGSVLTYITGDIVVLWFGLFLAIATTALIMNTCILRADWGTVVQEAQDRAAKDTSQLTESDERHAASYPA